MTPLLTIDVGNTRTKWGVHNGGWLAQGVVGNEQIADIRHDLQGWIHCSCAVISCVAGVSLKAELSEVLNGLGITPQFVQPQKVSCGVVNQYVDPSQLGSDRWAALLAAWDMTHAPCVVVNAGTALTVDVLSAQGEFMGGLIVPGLTAMKRAIASATAAIGVIDGQLQDFPVTTGDAVHSGALLAMAGAVEAMCHKLKVHRNEPECIVTGGDAAVLLPALHRQVRVADNLVLQGLVLIAGEMG